MGVVAIAFVPVPPLLVPEVAAGGRRLDEPMRQACYRAVARLEGHPVVVVGAAPESRRYVGGYDFRGFGVPFPATPPKDRLPLALGIGSWLLGGAEATLEGVRVDETVDACLARGRSLAERDVALLVCGDGTARRTEKAPGHLDPRAAGYDELVERALADGNPAGLEQLDPHLAGELMCSGRAAWQVAAGAATGTAWQAELLFADAPYGVFYAVATWSASPRPTHR